MSPQYYPPDDDMNSAGMDIGDYLVNFEHDALLQNDEVQGSMDVYQTNSFQNYPFSW